jgi:hypothetical protein
MRSAQTGSGSDLFPCSLSVWRTRPSQGLGQLAQPAMGLPRVALQPVQLTPQMWIQSLMPTEYKPIRWSLKTYDGELPKRIYRYRNVSPRTIDRLIDFEILDEGIYLAGLNELNDPDEGRFLPKFEGPESEILQYWRAHFKRTWPKATTEAIETEAAARTKHLLENDFVPPDSFIADLRYFVEHIVRIACFTTQPVNYSMWANYAKYVGADVSIGHAGICIEYECDEGWRHVNFHPVEYSDVLPEINFLGSYEPDLVRSHYMKTPEWSAEEEWRILSVLQLSPQMLQAPPENLTANSKIRILDGVRSVIFGLQTPKQIIEDVRDRVSVVKPHIRFKRVVRNLRTFNREIANI